MALQQKTYSVGSFAHGSDSNGYIADLILTEKSVDKKSNTSLLGYKLQLRSGSSNRFNWELTGTLSFGGSQVAVNTAERFLDYNSTWVILSGETTVDHDADGALALEFSAAITPYNGGTAYTPPTLSLSGTMPLTQIPRASTVSAAAANIEESTVISVARQDGAYTHTIHYSFGALSGYIQDAAGTLGTKAQKLSATTIVMPIPATFYEQIPNDPSGSCTLTCTTYSGSSSIGEAYQTTFTVTADPARCRPQLTGTAVDTNEACIEVTGSESVFVKGVSNVYCQATASAKNGATLQGVYINGVSGSTRTITGILTDEIVMRAYDSRGYYTDHIVSGLSLVEYTPVTCVIRAERDDPTSGDATLQIEGTWFPGSFGDQSNSLTIQYQIDDGKWPYATPVYDGSKYTATVALTDKDYTQSFHINVLVRDALTRAGKSTTLKKGIPVFDWGESDFQFHVPVQLKSGLSPMGQNTVMGESGYLFTGNADDIKDNAFLLTGEGVQNCPSDNGFLLVFGWKSGTQQVAFQICGNFQASLLQCRVYWYNTWRNWFRIPTETTV